MLTVAVSSRSLFHLEEANVIFETNGQEAFDAFMRAAEGVPLEPGCAFPLVKKLLALNTTTFPDKPDLVDVILLSRNSPDAGKRILDSTSHYGLRINRAVFTRGANRFRYAQAMGVDLFLCASESDAKHAIDNGMAAATIVPGGRQDTLLADMQDSALRIAFDGDSVVFSDEADAVTRDQGLRAFITHERDKADIPLGEGPFKRLMSKLHEMQVAFKARPGPSPLHIGLVTARDAGSHARVINTLRHWGITLDEVIFASGSAKGPILRAFGADFFFDDAGRNVESATLHNIAAGRVPFGNGAYVGRAA